MKTFSFIIPLILSILCLLYLLFYPCQSATTEYDFSAKVLAKENEHNTISNALFLTTDSSCKEKLEAYEQYYYYVSGRKNITFSISSHSIQYLKANLLSDTGKHISCQIQKKNDALLLTPSSKKTDTDRIFLCLTNQSVSDCNIKIQITTTNIVTPKPDKPTASNPKTTASKPNKSTASNPKTAAPKPDKPTASNPKTAAPKPDKSTASNPKTAALKPDKSTASNPKTVTTKPDKILSKDYKKIVLQPQFLLLPPDTSKKITITNGTQKNTTKKFTWLSTNSNVATVKNGIIITHQEGTAIIYLKDKENANNTSSCLIRVLNTP